MRKILLGILFFVISSNIGFADRIYFKSGEVLEGKLREPKSGPLGQWCEDEGQVPLDDGKTIRCVELADIVRVEKILKKPEGTALLAKEENWGESEFGYRTQLIPMSEEFVVGKPMLFGLLLKNDTDTLKWFDDQAIAYSCFKIVGPNGAPVMCIQPVFSTGGNEKPLDTGEIAILSDRRDISGEYVITQPGKYSIQFDGHNYGIGLPNTFPKSNVVEFLVQPGTGKSSDRLYEKFAGIVRPPNWYLYSGWRTGAGPAGREKVESLVFTFAYMKKLQNLSDYYVPVWVTKTPAPLQKAKVATAQTMAPQSAKDSLYQSSPVQTSHYLGQNRDGYFYAVISEQARNDWPGIVTDLRKGLDLKIGKSRVSE